MCTHRHKGGAQGALQQQPNIHELCMMLYIFDCRVFAQNERREDWMQVLPPLKATMQRYAKDIKTWQKEGNHSTSLLCL